MYPVFKVERLKLFYHKRSAALVTYRVYIFSYLFIFSTGGWYNQDLQCCQNNGADGESERIWWHCTRYGPTGRWCLLSKQNSCRWLAITVATITTGPLGKLALSKRSRQGFWQKIPRQWLAVEDWSTVPFNENWFVALWDAGVSDVEC